MVVGNYCSDKECKHGFITVNGVLMTECQRRLESRQVMTVSNSKDTNQASELYELCKKVYELTEWDNDGDLDAICKDGDVYTKDAAWLYSLNYVPFYTSDYLLEKLPNVINYHSETSSKTILGLFRLVHCESGQWLATYSKLKLDCYADTPLKALLKLTIALSEAGELK